jgi:large subunit ribosomal protein L4
MAALNVKIYNAEGAASGELTLDPKVFGVVPNKSLIHQVVVAHESNARESIAHTKTRGEVRGGGKKPWKQKHTGRARHGSTRSPIWKGGGAVFGPRNTRNWELKVNKKSKRAALKMVLSAKVADAKLVVLDSFDVKEYKTKPVALRLKKLPSAGRKLLLALPVMTPEAWKSVKNIPNVEVSRTDSLNVVDLLKRPYLITTTDGIAALTKTLS